MLTSTNRVEGVFDFGLSIKNKRVIQENSLGFIVAIPMRTLMERVLK